MNELNKIDQVGGARKQKKNSSSKPKKITKSTKSTKLNKKTSRESADVKPKTKKPVVESTESETIKSETTKSEITVSAQEPEQKIIIPTIQIKNSTNIFESDPNIKFSYNIDYCNFGLGFNVYLHENKKKLLVLNDFVNKKKVYNVLNKFEKVVDNYDESIETIATKYFYFTKQPAIISRGFYKLWEIYFMFDLIDLDEKNFISAHLAEDEGSLIQSTIFLS